MGAATPPNNYTHRNTSSHQNLSEVREIVNQHVATLSAELGTKIEALKEAFDRQALDHQRVPTLLQTATLNLRELMESKIHASTQQIEANLSALSEVTRQQFNTIAVRFEEIDKRTVQLSIADKTAIAAALQAQKEAAGAQNEANSSATAKMEKNFSDLIAQGQTMLQEIRRNNENQINDLKSRLDKGEGLHVLEARVDRREGATQGGAQLWAWICAGVGMVWGAASTVALLIHTAR